MQADKADGKQIHRPPLRMRPPENEKNGESYNSPFFMYLHRCRSVDIPPIGFVVRRSGFHLDLQFDHIDGRGGGFVALVAVTASAAVQSLLHVVHGQHAEGDLRRLAGAQDFVYAAPLNLVYIADMSAYEGKNIPAEHVRYLCGQDAAGYAENVNLYTAGHGLKSITRGSAPETELLKALGLDPGRYFMALAQTVGK